MKKAIRNVFIIRPFLFLYFFSGKSCVDPAELSDAHYLFILYESARPRQVSILISSSFIWMRQTRLRFSIYFVWKSAIFFSQSRLAFFRSGPAALEATFHLARQSPFCTVAVWVCGCVCLHVAKNAILKRLCTASGLIISFQAALCARAWSENQYVTILMSLFINLERLHFIFIFWIISIHDKK